MCLKFLVLLLGDDATADEIRLCLVGPCADDPLRVLLVDPGEASELFGRGVIHVDAPGRPAYRECLVDPVRERTSARGDQTEESEAELEANAGHVPTRVPSDRAVPAFVA